MITSNVVGVPREHGAAHYTSWVRGSSETKPYGKSVVLREHEEQHHFSIGGKMHAKTPT